MMHFNIPWKHCKTSATEMGTEIEQNDRDGFKWVKPYFLLEPFLEALTIGSCQKIAGRTWTCAEPRLRVCWIKFCIGDSTI